MNNHGGFPDYLFIEETQLRPCKALSEWRERIVPFSLYVFVSEESIRHERVLERCYISEKEKEYYKGIRSSEAKPGDVKSSFSR